MLKSLKTTKLIPLTILATVLAGCAGIPSHMDQTAEAISLSQATNTPSWYLNKIQPGQMDETRQSYTLLAAHAFLNLGDYTNADKLLQSINPKKIHLQEIKAEYLFLSSLSLTQQSRWPEALATLGYPANWKLESWQWEAYYRLKAKIYAQLQQPVDEVRQLSLLESYLPANQRSEINDMIWRALQPLTDSQVAPYTQDRSSIFAGWMQLAYIVKHYAVTPNELVKYLGQWQQMNPSHPGAVKLPTDLEKALNTKPYRPDNIAVLLPLTGARAKIANPLKQGILASYLATENPKVAVNFYDTSTDVTKAYQDAVAAGAQFIIGPLLQSNVEKLQNFLAQPDQYGVKIPQLFLNQNVQNASVDDLFYFSLSPSQEAADAAQKLFQDGIRMPLLLVSNDRMGLRMAEAFKQEWKELTGKETEVYAYQDGSKMGLAVKEALGVADSQQRITRMKQLIGGHLKADFRSRRDIDAIYMVASGQDLTLLKPFIDVNFSVFAEPVPLYTASRGRLENDADDTAIELNNITISEIPWLMESNDETKAVTKLWPAWNNSKKRLYVMGFDALNLVGRLAQMRAFPGYQYTGRSGLLSVNANGMIDRHLSWARYQNGQLKPLQDAKTE